MEKDFYETFDPKAVKPLIPFIEGKKYVEPCYGNGALVRNIGDVATCVRYSDISIGVDALTINEEF